MNTNENKNKLKISKTFLAIGGILMAIGIIMLIVGIVKYIDVKKQYDVDYEAWRKLFMNHEAGVDSAPEMPGFPLLAIAGVFVAFFGIPFLFIGLRPFIMKMGAKMHTETLDYAGKDISEAGVKTIDVAKPVIEKGAETITPVVGNLAGTVAEAISTGVSSGKAKLICPHCKKKVPEDSVFCPKCGERILEEE